MPETFRYTDEHPYIGKGLNRYSKLGKAYTLAEADLAEFNVQNRGGKGVISYKVTEKTGKVVGSFVVGKEDQLMIISEDGTVTLL